MKKLVFIGAALLVAMSTAAQEYSKYGDVKFQPEGSGFPRVTENTKIVYVDKDSHAYGNDLFMSCTAFSDGVAAYKDPASKKWGLIDTKGNVVKAPFFVPAFGESVPVFVDGLAFVKAPQGERGYHLIDKSGEVVKKLPNIAKIGQVNKEDGCVGVLYYGSFYTGSKYGYLDFKGNPKFEAASATGKYVDVPQVFGFSAGLMPFLNQVTKLWGYVNEQGTVAIKAQYQKAEPFSDALAAVCKDGKWGFIDAKGAVALDFKYSEQPSGFNHNRATVVRVSDNMNCVIDKTGTILKEYRTLSDFDERGWAMALVSDGRNREQCLVIDTVFRQVYNFGQMPMISFQMGRVTFENDNKVPFVNYGDFFVAKPEGWTSNYVLDTDFNVVFSAAEIGRFSDGLAFVLFDEPEKPRQSGFVNPQGEVVILFKYNEF